MDASGPGGARAESVPEYEWDLVTIGIGSGGTRASRISASFGAKVAAVELPFNPISSDTEGGIGGTCVLRGCVPKKILMYGSAFSAEFEDAREYGWNIPGQPTFNWKTLVDNKTKEITRLNSIYKRMLNNAKVKTIEGRGFIVDPHTVEVTSADGETKTLTTKNILIATGGQASYLDVPGKELAITSDEALSLSEMPQHIIIIGGGYIAVEFAGIFNGMGSKVDLYYRSNLPLRGFDEELRSVVVDNLVKRGVSVHPGGQVSKIEKLQNGKLKFTDTDGKEMEADAVMMATGRTPKTKDLGLENIGVELDAKGAIKVDAYSKTTVPNVWAVGDVTNRMNLTPVAIMEGQCFAKTVFGNEPQKPDHTLIPSAVFCQPPLSVVGLTEEEAIAQATSDLHIFTSTFTPMKFSICGRQEKTFMKIIVDSASDKVLGVGMVGPDAAEIMQGIGVALKCGATKKQFDSTVGIHPTAAEEFVTMKSVTRTVPLHRDVVKDT